VTEWNVSNNILLLLITYKQLTLILEMLDVVKNAFAVIWGCCQFKETKFFFCSDGLSFWWA